MCIDIFIVFCVCVFASTYVNACLMNVTDKKINCCSDYSKWLFQKHTRILSTAKTSIHV